MDFYGTNPGPIDDSVLYDQEKHVSSAIWEGQVKFHTCTDSLLCFIREVARWVGPVWVIVQNGSVFRNGYN